LEELFIANVDLAGIDHEAVKRAEAKLPRNFDRVGGLYIPPVSPSTAGLLPGISARPEDVGMVLGRCRQDPRLWHKTVDDQQDLSDFLTTFRRLPANWSNFYIARVS